MFMSLFALEIKVDSYPTCQMWVDLNDDHLKSLVNLVISTGSVAPTSGVNDLVKPNSPLAYLV